MKSLKKISASLLAFFGIGTLTACYGMPPQNFDETFTVYGRVSKLDGNGDTVNLEGIKVSVLGAPEIFTQTDKSGYYELTFTDSSVQTICFESINFENDTVKIRFNSPGPQTCDVLLKENKE